MESPGGIGANDEGPVADPGTEAAIEDMDGKDDGVPGSRFGDRPGGYCGCSMNGGDAAWLELL